MDDRNVRDLSEDGIVTCAAYLLLYRRRHGPAAAISPGRLNYSDPEEIDWKQRQVEIKIIACVLQLLMQKMTRAIQSAWVKSDFGPKWWPTYHALINLFPWIRPVPLPPASFRVEEAWWLLPSWELHRRVTSGIFFTNRLAFFFLQLLIYISLSSFYLFSLFFTNLFPLFLVILLLLWFLCAVYFSAWFLQPRDSFSSRNCHRDIHFL